MSLSTRCIYCFENLTNGKKYIGQSRNCHARVYNHWNLLSRGKHGNLHLQAAFNQFGRSAFSFCILEALCADSPDWLLDIMEKGWIVAYCSDIPLCGYNHESGGCQRKSHTEETKKKIASANSRRKVTEETKAKLRAHNLGKKQSPESIRKNRISNQGRIHSEATKAKISAANQGGNGYWFGKKHSQLTRDKMRVSALIRSGRAD